MNPDEITNEERWLINQLSFLVEDAKAAHAAKDGPPRQEAIGVLITRLETVYDYFKILMPTEPSKKMTDVRPKPQSKVGRVVKSIIGGG